MTTTTVVGAEIVDQQGRRRQDVMIDDESGLIVDVGTELRADETIDGSSCWLCPGFIDLQVHLRQPGFETAGTIESGSRAAVLGGYTAVIAAPDTEPCTDNAAVVSEVLALAKGAMCDVVPAAALTVGRAGTELAPYLELAELGVRLFTDSARSVLDPVVARRAIDYLSGVGESLGVRLVAAQRGGHELAASGVMNEGEWSSRLGLAGQPAAAEELAVGRDLALARLTGTALHLQQVSTAGAVELIRAAKAAKTPVTAEVSPNHLVLTDADLSGYDTNRKLDPPLRTRADVDALRAAVVDGTIDAITTDHAPWAVDAKERPFDGAPFGAIGLETALAVLLTETDLSIEQLLPALSWQPAAIAGLAGRHGGPIEKGRPANLTVVDPHATWTVEPARLGGYATNSPFLGRQLQGQVRHTVVHGEPVVVDGKALR